jgi:hypothetical protein
MEEGLAAKLDKQSSSRMRAFIPAGPVSTLLADIERWAANSGEEWTVNRLKTIRRALLSFMDGMKAESAKILALGGIAYHRDGTPKGPFRYVYRLAERDAFAAWNVAMVYSQFRFLRITKSAWEKFHTKVTTVTYAATSEDKNTFSRGLEVLESVFGLKPKYNLVEEILPIYHHSFSPTRRALIGPLMFGSEIRGVLDLRGLEPLMFEHRTIFERILGDSMSSWVPPESDRESYGYRGPDGFVESAGSLYDAGAYIVGSIHCIPEPGYKARVVANPKRLIQKALTPLGDWLFEQLRQLPMDSTFDQDRGRRIVQGELAACNRLSSVDLTSATDSFPRLHSQELLQHFVGEPFSTFMEDLARGQWVLPYREFGHFLPKPSLKEMFPDYSDRYFRKESWDDPVGGNPYWAAEWEARQRLGLTQGFGTGPEFDKNWERYTEYLLEHHQPQTVSWAQGQPLGTYPSFAEFALSHHAVILGLIAEMGLPWESYQLLGDDVVLFDDGLAERYCGIMARFGVEINSSKGLHSSRLAEFAGHILSAESDIPSYRWHRPGDDNFWDICRNVGSMRARDLLSKRQARVFDILRIAPQNMGGLGLNPEGIPLSEREEAFEDLQQEYERPVTYRTPVSVLNRLLYNTEVTPGCPGEPVLPDRGRLVEYLRSVGIVVPLEEVPRVLAERPGLGDGLPIEVREAVRLWLVPHADKTSTPRLDQLEIALGLKGYERQRHWLESRRRLASAHPGS